MDDDVTWAVIPGYSDYAVSDDGRVWNTKLNKEVGGDESTASTTVHIRSDDGFSHKYYVFRLQEMVLFEKKESVRVRKIRIVGTNQIYDTVAETAWALDTDISSVYRVLRGERERVMGVGVEYFYM